MFIRELNGIATPEDRRGDSAGRYTVDPDIHGAQLSSSQSGVVSDGGLGGGIKQRALAVADRGNTGVVDDRSTTALLHVWDGMFDAQGDTGKQELHRVLYRLSRNLR